MTVAAKGMDATHKSKDGTPVMIFHFPDLRWKMTSAPPTGDQARYGGFAQGVHARSAAPDGGPRIGWGPFLIAAIGLAVLIASVCLSSCTVMTGNGTGFTYASFAGNAEGMQISPSGASAAKIDNSTGAQLARDAVGDVASAYTWGKAFGAITDLIEEGADVIKDGNATDEAINADNNATKKAIKTFVPPEPTVPAP